MYSFPYPPLPASTSALWPPCGQAHPLWLSPGRVNFHPMTLPELFFFAGGHMAPPPDHDSTIFTLVESMSRFRCCCRNCNCHSCHYEAPSITWNEEANEMTLWRIARSFCRRQSECALHKAQWKFEDSLSVLAQGELSFVTHCGLISVASTC